MKSVVLLFAACFVLVPRTAAASKGADIVVVAELVRGAQSQPHCGVLAVVGEYEFRVLRVERGTLAEQRIVVEALCPEMSVERYHVSRLRLSTKRSHTYRPWNKLANAPKKRLYLRKQSPFTVDYPALLNKPIGSLRARFTRTGVSSDGWEQFGPGMQAKIANKKVSAIRLACPRGFPRVFAWAGLPKVRWQRFRRRGGFSAGSFTGPGQLRGRVARGRIELSVMAP